MNQLLVLGAILAALWAVFLWLRVPSILLFLSILVGNLLATEIGFGAYDFASSVVRVNDPHIVQLVLLFLPVILSVLFLRGKLSKSRLVTEAIPLLFASAALALFASPFIPKLTNALNNATNDHLDSYRSLIIVCASASILVLTWISFGRNSQEHHGKHHK